jgi:hypothetical protein
MSIDNFPAAARHDRNTKSELDDGGRHPIDHVIVLAGIAGVVDQSIGWPVLKSQCGG